MSESSHAPQPNSSISLATHPDGQFTPPQLASREYVEVILPLPLATTFTYRLPAEMAPGVEVGSRVVVPFGAKKFYTAIVVNFVGRPRVSYELKDVAMVVDQYPILRHPQLKLWQWIADYYLCAIGDVYKAALPAGLKIESETFVEVNPDFDIARQPLSTDLEAEIYQLLSHEEALTVQAIQKKIERKGVAADVGRMLNAGILIISEKLVERYVVKKVSYVELTCGLDRLSEAFEAVKRSERQQRLLLAYLELSGIQRGEHREVAKAVLLERADADSAAFSALQKKGILGSYVKEVSRFRYDGEGSGQLPELTEPQRFALQQIHEIWREREVTLLHGVTSSGKTELYIHLIDYVLKKGDQVLYLVPEIALTTQLTYRLQKVFGSRVVIYHSKFSDNERVDIWKKLLQSSEPVVVIGARSAVFLPFHHLGLVIVDEEHEASYKQFDPAPRYNGRDVAMVLARMHGAKTLLGTATPAIETYHKALSGKFGLVGLSTRYGDVSMPEMRVVDTSLARRTGRMKGALAVETEEVMGKALGSGSQVILFQNRRGYAPQTRCKQCAWVPKCTQCDVALTYHQKLRQLQCHYCGAVYPVPTVCPQCKEPAIEIIGYGTERIEEEVADRFPKARMLRMDLDTTRRKDSYIKIIDDFSEGKADILVGTQMVSKGLDFGNVSAVAVLNADALIYYPDFRSSERAFNMLEQVAGRAGRRAQQPGTVVIQTSQPQHEVIRNVRAHDYAEHYKREIEERQRFFYPPFSRIIYVYLKHRDPGRLRELAEVYATGLRKLLGNRVFGPEEPAISRIQGLYIRKVMLKIEPSASVDKIRDLLRGHYVATLSRPDAKGLLIYYDVDPY